LLHAEGVNAARATAEALNKEVVRMAVDSALAAYSAGRVTLVTVIEASRALWDARSELVMADRVLAEAWARLERAVANPQQRLVPYVEELPGRSILHAALLNAKPPERDRPASLHHRASLAA
jgi:hypothetical protein